ncbi:MAG: glycosyltransferase family 39 protein [Thermoanaerobaculales bacterium]|nr:glycosyltransferase family 39 protein [Thermoanaerobaculales bacterium]
MNLTTTGRRTGGAAGWLLAAAALWIIGAAVDRRSEVLIENLGGHLRFAVAGTELVVPTVDGRVDGVTLWAADSIQPPRVRSWEIVHDDATERPPLPRMEPRRDGDPAPVGDWWVDAHAADRRLAEHPVALDGDVEIRLRLTGRTAREFGISLGGDTTFHFGLRRGIMDNYLVIREAGGGLVGVTTLDPTPAADLGALLAQLLRALAAACLVILFIRLTALAFPNKAPARPCNELCCGAGAPAGEISQPERSGGLLHKAAGPIAVVLALAAVALSSWAAVRVLGAMPHQIDEVIYLLQSRWLLDGEVAPRAAAVQEHLGVPFTYLVDGRWIGHYPVGWPALLAVGLAVGAPHLVTPVLGGIFVLVVFAAGREIDDELTGLAAAVLAAVSPLLRLLGCTFFPHPACAVLVTLALWLLLIARRRPGWWWGAGAGLAMGCCLAIRPLTAVAVSLVFGVWLLGRALAGQPRRRTWITAGSAVAAGLVASLPTLVHNAVVTGSAFSLPYSLASGAMYDASLVPFGIRNLDAIFAAASSSLYGWGWPLAAGGLSLALPFAAIALPFVLRRARSEDLLLLALLLVMAVALLPTRAHGLHGYGARYLVDVAACLVLLSARGFRELARWARPSRTAAITVAVIFILFNLSALVVLPTRLGLYRGYDDVTGELERQLDATGQAEAIVLIDDADWRPWAEAARLMTGNRRHAIAVGADLGDNSVITGAHPERPVFYWDGAVLRSDDRGKR